ncbi:hypothetical protein HZ994_12520 [Akkermansiaceae bacterium]|nr:hypothetical protein HZ994_12520 [Akkermansiaceae bacterium]
MRISAIGDVLKVWVWAVGSLVVGLWLTPVAYNGGKALSELSATKDFSGVVNKLAAWSGAARLEDFFKVCWPVAALVSLFPLIEWLRLGGGGAVKGSWSVRLPHMASHGNGEGQAIRPNRWGPLQGLVGFLMTFGAFVLIGYMMVRAGAFRWEADGAAWQRDLVFDIGWTLALAAVVEIFFRCVVLGIFLRAMRTAMAIGLAALMFGGIRFILGGFGNAEAFDGETLSAVHLTGVVFGGGDFVGRVVTVLIPWFAFGCVLGWARWRTASVWLPGGLLMGWLLAERIFSKAAHPVEVADRVAGYLFSGSVQAGIIPLIGVLAMGGLVHLFTHGSRNACH